MTLDLKIDPDLGLLETADGERIVLTASERRALHLLMANPQRLLTRSQILDAVSEPGSDKSDRNVDFLINRLRRKLSDDARNPRYIATRYGEGYIWIAGAQPSVREIAGADVVLGRIVGLEFHADPSSLREASRDIFTALSEAFGPDVTSVYAPDCPAPESFKAEAPSHMVELAFFLEGDRTNCLVTVREFRSGRAEVARRFVLDALLASPGELRREMEAIVDLLWLRRVDTEINHEPLAVSAFTATAGQDIRTEGPVDPTDMKTLHSLNDEQRRSLKSILENERRLRRLLDADTGNAELKLLLAMTIQSRYVKAGPTLFATGADTRDRDEDEIETLVTEALPFIRSRPEHVIVAGKLLHFLKRGYDELGRELCETAYAESVSVAGSLSVIGQMRSFFGETDAALQCLNQALSFSRPGSHAHLYTLVIKCQALAAAGDWERLKAARRELSASNRLAGLALEIYFGDPTSPTVLSRALTFLFPRDRMIGCVTHAHYVGARLFSDPERGGNLMHCVTRLVARRHGVSALHEEVAVAYPQLIARLSDEFKHSRKNSPRVSAASR